MGGFYLKGPTLRFKSRPQSRPCRCMGLRANIDEQTEKMLASDPQQLLVPANLPDEDLQALCARRHLGDELHYDIVSAADIKRRLGTVGAHGEPEALKRQKTEAK